MQELEFAKSHGTGNDFVIIDCLRYKLDGIDLSALASRLCDRNFGVGGDGLILVLPSEAADYRMRILNSDGSEAEMCGNGIRCFAKYLLDRGLAGRAMTVETPVGIKTVEMKNDGIGFTVDMGKPHLEAEEIPVIGFDGKVISRPLDVTGVKYNITCVSMGNPHCVIFVDAVDDVPLEVIGPKIEAHPAFPRRTNVEFAQVLARDGVKVRVWERGAGITLACGTGACASVVAGALTGRLDRKATVHLPGGGLSIDWRDSDEVFMTGPAVEVFTGTVKL